MCGINGIISKSYTSDRLRDAIHSMNNDIIHRGPDSDGIFIDKNILSQNSINKIN